MDDDYPEEVVVKEVYPRLKRDAEYILERWRDYKYVEVGRAHTEEEALAKAQKIADKREQTIRVRMKNSWDD